MEYSHWSKVNAGIVVQWANRKCKRRVLIWIIQRGRLWIGCPGNFRLINYTHAYIYLYIIIICIYTNVSLQKKKKKRLFTENCSRVDQKP